MKILNHHGSLFLACMVMTFGLPIDASRASAAQTGTERAGPDLAAIDAYVSKQMRDLGIPGGCARHRPGRSDRAFAGLRRRR